MGGEGFFEKTVFWGNEGILGRSEEENNNDKTEEETAVFRRQEQGSFNLDLNLQPAEFDIGNDFSGFDFGFPDEQTENFANSEMAVFGADLKRTERCPDVEIVGCSSKKRRFSVEEKGKATIIDISDDDDENCGGGQNLNLDLDWGFMQMEIDNYWTSFLDLPVEAEMPNYTEIDFFGGSFNTVNHTIDHVPEEVTANHTIDHVPEEVTNKTIDETDDFYLSRKKEESRRHHEIAKEFAQTLAREVNPDRDISKSSTRTSNQETSKNSVLSEDDKAEDSERPFGMVFEMIKTRNSNSSSRKKHPDGVMGTDFKWVPKRDRGFSLIDREVPSLLDLSLRTLAKNAEAMVSLNHVPDTLRHKLSKLVCDYRKMDAHFVGLLADGSPTEIRVSDCSRVSEDEFTQIFRSCDTKNLIVLQLDLCGSCMPDYVLQHTLARSSKSLPALVSLSLNGAYRLSDKGLNSLAMSAPALQSINLSHCSLLTSAGIKNLATCFKSTLRELYLDECHNIEAMVVLPALKRLKCIEVLSVAGIQSVCDGFVIKMVEACGKNMKELVFANCRELTDLSIKSVGKNCSRLCALDLSYLCNLTDLSIRYIANGCRSINRLKLCHNSFSDEAIAAFLEASGSSLTELALNKIVSVGVNTALSLAKCSRKLLSLDLSWCRNLTDEALGLIVDSCLSLMVLKLFGCTQITEQFLSGHSNAKVQIIGLKMTTVTKYLNLLELQDAPLRYSPVNSLLIIED